MFAMNEGWAEFVEALVEDNALNLRAYVNADLPNVESNQWWTGAIDGNGSNTDGSIVEGAVASILWDITDTPKSIDTEPGTDDDQISDMFAQLWEIFTSDHPKSIIEVAEGWQSRSFPEYKHLVSIYLNHGIQLEPNEAPVIRIDWPSSLLVTDGLLTVRWDASDPDGDSVTVDIYYDEDRKQPGNLIVSELVGSQYQWHPVALGIPDGAYYIYIVVSDSKGGIDGVYTEEPIIVDRSPITAPIITSSTHPDQAKWYEDRDVEIKLASESSEFSIALDRSAGTEPDEIADHFDSAISYSSLPDGTWWIHARAYSNLGYWSDTSHYRLNIRESPPTPWDVNNDGVTNILDLVSVAKSFGSASESEDLNGDGRVNVLDLVLVASHFDEANSIGAPVMEAPGMSVLLQCYPNPFNPEVWLPFVSSESGQASVSIYDISGRIVRYLDLGHVEPGLYISKPRAPMWDGRDNHGNSMPSGVYFYSVAIDGSVIGLRKAILER
jgi:hypothetical protein